MGMLLNLGHILNRHSPPILPPSLPTLVIVGSHWSIWGFSLWSSFPPPLPTLTKCKCWYPCWVQKCSASHSNLTIKLIFICGTCYHHHAVNGIQVFESALCCRSSHPVFQNMSEVRKWATLLTIVSWKISTIFRTWLEMFGAECSQDLSGWSRVCLRSPMYSFRRLLTLCDGTIRSLRPVRNFS